MVTREEGLVILATAASLSVEEVEEMNPILYIRQFLNDVPDDPVELLMKMCQMFGPYTYRELAILYSNPRLSTIQEISEPSSSAPSPSSSSSDAIISDISDTFTDVDLCNTFTDVDLSGELVDRAPTPVECTVIPITETITRVTSVPIPIPDAVHVPIGCGCFPWFQKRPK